MVSTPVHQNAKGSLAGNASSGAGTPSRSSPQAHCTTSPTTAEGGLHRAMSSDDRKKANESSTPIE